MTFVSINLSNKLVPLNNLITLGMLYLMIVKSFSEFNLIVFTKIKQETVDTACLNFAVITFEASSDESERECRVRIRSIRRCLRAISLEQVMKNKVLRM